MGFSWPVNGKRVSLSSWMYLSTCPLVYGRPFTPTPIIPLGYKEITSVPKPSSPHRHGPFKPELHAWVERALRPFFDLVADR